tara:strand:- start:10162 stop:10653 length:492 start_codon:yes stop_codon:yes gene_type:complete
MPNWLAIAQLGLTAFGAMNQMQVGNDEKTTADLNAYNLETDKRRGDIEARQRHNDRLDTYRSNLSTNIAAFYAMRGDDVSNDPSVKAFLKRNRETATRDNARSDFMGAAEGMKAMQAARSTRQEGRARQSAAYVNAFTSLGSGLTSYYKTRVPTTEPKITKTT